MSRTLRPIAQSIIDVSDQAGNPWYVRTDINLDGRTDFLFYANSLRSWSATIEIPPAAEVRLMVQQPSGQFLDQTAHYITGNRSSLMGVDLTGGNFNNDPILDFVLAGSGWDPYLDGKPVHPEGFVPGEQDYFYISDPSGRLQVRDSQHANMWSHNVSVGDINNDGFDDVFSSSVLAGSDDSGAERSFLAISDGQGGFIMDQSRLPRLLVDRDGVFDWTKPTAPYIDEHGKPIKSGATFTGSAMLDANGDGHVDLVVLPMSSSKTGLVYFNDGNGHFSDTRVAELPRGPFGYGGYDEAWGAKGTIQLEGKAADMDGDGDDDLLVLSTNDDRRDGKFDYYNRSVLQLLKNDGHGNFSVAQQIELMSSDMGNYSYYANIEIMDINRDGLPDVVATSPVHDDRYDATVILINQGGWLENQTLAYLPEGSRKSLHMPFHDDGKLNFLKYEQTAYALDPRDGIPLYDAIFTNLQSSVPIGNTISGSAHSEVIIGSSRGDSFLQSSGNDILDGQGGTDVLYARGNRDNYRFEQTVEGWRLVDRHESSDTLRSIEYVAFDDGSLSRLTDTITEYSAGAILRFYNTETGVHFYTGSAAEAASVLVNIPAYHFEGHGFHRPDPSAADAVNVYRFYNTQTDTHFYTASQGEADHVRATNDAFLFEGVVYQARAAASDDTVGVHRFFNTNTGTHFYTASEQESENVKLTLAGHMQYEGIAYYVNP